MSDVVPVGSDRCGLDPPQLVLGFGDTSQRAIRAGIAVLGVAASSQLPEHYPQAG